VTDMPTSNSHDLYLLLGRMDGKLDAVVKQQAAADENFRKHNDRLQELEKSKWTFLGASSAVSFIVSTAVALIAVWPFK